jgi:predicted RNA-binding Zn ribbon-like protein
MNNDLITAFTKTTIGGHIALDFLNTVPMVNGSLADAFHSDEDVQVWLAEYSLTNQIKFKPGELLEATRELRESIREQISAKKEGRPIEYALINLYLFSGTSHLELVEGPDNQLKLERRRQVATVKQLLAPIAEAAAELLVMEAFSIIRRCESPECVLWFYDRTKGHKRRWCSMAICGNRHKVSSFRKRQNA